MLRLRRIEVELRHAELTLQFVQLFKIDRPHDVHDSELPRFARYDGETYGLVFVHHDVDIDVGVRSLAVGFHQAIPTGRRKLLPYRIDIFLTICGVLVKCVASDIDSLQSLDDIPSCRILRIVSIQEPRSQRKQRGIERNRHGLRRLLRQRRKIRQQQTRIGRGPCQSRRQQRKQYF